MYSKRVIELVKINISRIDNYDISLSTVELIELRRELNDHLNKTLDRVKEH